MKRNGFQFEHVNNIDNIIAKVSTQFNPMLCVKLIDINQLLSISMIVNLTKLNVLHDYDKNTTGSAPLCIITIQYNILYCISKSKQYTGNNYV